MDSSNGAGEAQFTCQVVAIPYPGRGHINPMMNLCELIVTRRPDILITFIVTEEWYGFIGFESRPQNIRFGKIPNVIPSEIGRGKDFLGFVEAVMTNMESPVEKLLDQLEPPFPSAILYDTFLPWIVGLANRRNIPAASLWTQSATVFSIILHIDILLQKGHIPFNQSEEALNYVPGIPSIRVRDLPRVFLDGKGRKLFDQVKDAISVASRARYLLFSSVHELESQVIDTLNEQIPTRIYSIGPAIPYFKITEHSSTDPNHRSRNYIAWLDAQPKDSVLYMSQGSFLSSAGEELKEIVGGVLDSSVRFFMVARKDVPAFQGVGSSDKGLVVPWCDQLKVLCHPSIGGFWSHCGWNSTKEGAYAGIPMLTFPIIWDQFTNSKQIVEDWKMGWRVKKDHDQSLVTREEISSLLNRFMDLECEEGKEMRRRAKDVREICLQATAEGGSAELAIEAFIKNISSEDSIRFSEQKSGQIWSEK